MWSVPLLPSPRRSETIPNGTRRRKEEASKESSRGPCNMSYAVLGFHHRKHKRWEKCCTSSPSATSRDRWEGSGRSLSPCEAKGTANRSCSARQLLGNKGKARLGAEGLWITVLGTGPGPLSQGHPLAQSAQHLLEPGEPQMTSTQQ